MNIDFSLAYRGQTNTNKIFGSNIIVRRYEYPVLFDKETRMFLLQEH